MFTSPHKVGGDPLRLIMQDIRTPRSFRPSSEFIIQTMSKEGYIIDQGGSDISVVMSQMNTMTSLAITP